jgi:hypothetical protein
MELQEELPEELPEEQVLEIQVAATMVEDFKGDSNAELI